MLEVWDELEFDAETRVVVLTGEGESWCAGQDLKESFLETANNPLELRRSSWAASEWRWRRLYYFPKPTIAMVNGYCFGGGFTQLVACDFAIAAESARYDLAFQRLGLSGADVGVPWLLNRLIGPVLASYYVLTAGVIDAAEGHRLGLFAQVVPRGELLAAARAAALKIAQAPAPAVRISKLALRSSLNTDLSTSVELDAYLQSYAFRTPGHKQRIGEYRQRISSKGR